MSNEVVDAKLDGRVREFARRLAGYSVRVQLRRDECETGARWTIRGFLGFLGFQDSQDSWLMVH